VALSITILSAHSDTTGNDSKTLLIVCKALCKLSVLVGIMSLDDVDINEPVARFGIALRLSSCLSSVSKKLPDKFKLST
jgi:hypothetical protein